MSIKEQFSSWPILKKVNLFIIFLDFGHTSSVQDLLLVPSSRSLLARLREQYGVSGIELTSHSLPTHGRVQGTAQSTRDSSNHQYGKCLLTICKVNALPTILSFQPLNTNLLARTPQSYTLEMVVINQPLHKCKMSFESTKTSNEWGQSNSTAGTALHAADPASYMEP